MMIRAGNIRINPRHVASMTWNRTFYANAPGDSTLIVSMVDGTTHHIKHEPSYIGGTDAYEIERQIESQLETDT